MSWQVLFKAWNITYIMVCSQASVVPAFALCIHVFYINDTFVRNAALIV